MRRCGAGRNLAGRSEDGGREPRRQPQSEGVQERSQAGAEDKTEREKLMMFDQFELLLSPPNKSSNVKHASKNVANLV